MLIVHPTYIVTVKSKFDGEDEIWRVSQPNLDSFIRVVLFNGYEFDLRRERDPVEVTPSSEEHEQAHSMLRQRHEAALVDDMLKHTHPVDPERFAD